MVGGFGSTRVLISLGFVVLLNAALVHAQVSVTTPQEQFGFNIGDDYHLVTYTELEAYWRKLDRESPRMRLVETGKTAEGRAQYMAIITSPENHTKLERYRDISGRLALAEGLTDAEARMLAQEGKAVVWIDGGLHATEVVGSHQLIEMVYQMVSLDDRETMRFLDDVILLAFHANPDGMELVSSWYMRQEDPGQRNSGDIPRLYQKYVGHDNNRDSYMVNQPETENMNRIMYREWFPQVMYNHHQTGPADIIVFVPPFRDPPNYNCDPLLVLGIEAFGAAMHSRLVAEDKPGSGMRSRANYSIWFNGNVRTTGYFHNQIGLLTEIKGNPTPMELAFWPDRQLPSIDMTYPHVPGEWHFRKAIDYSITLNRAVMDYASRQRETLLYNRYLMGRNSIDRGSRDHWTIHPKIVDMVIAEASKDPEAIGALAPAFRRRGSGVPKKYLELFRMPENRDPRGFILPADQPDFPTATKFVNTFIKNGVTVHQATREFQVAGNTYPAGSYVVKASQAFRPHVMDMFEPQDHPNDFLYPGGPPIPPYDNAGYTLAFQMGVEFDRILNEFDGPFEEIEEYAKPLPGTVTNAPGAAGFLLRHEANDAFIATNRLLASDHEVYWLKEPLSAGGNRYPVGTIYIVATSSTQEMVEEMAEELGLSFAGVASAPSGEALHLRPVRIGLWDRYGGSMPSGWTRWLFEQFEFPFEVVYPKALDAGDLSAKFDVLVFVTDAIPPGEVNMAPRAGPGRGGQPAPETIPADYQSWLGSVTTDKTVPELVKFLEAGATILAIGSSTNLGPLVGLPMGNHIVDGRGSPLETEQYYIPSSVLHVRVDNTHPLAYGLKDRVDVFFNNSSVFRLHPDAEKNGVTRVAWFDSDRPLRSGWAWGQDRLYGGVAIAEGDVGNGKLFLYGPEVLFRGQSHGTFKLFFNGVFLGGAETVQLGTAATDVDK
jgi:hypothetical protein